MSKLTAQTLWNDLQKIREQSPLIHNITNYVVMNFSANILLAVGASPVMAHAVEEVQEMVAHAQSLVVNIGTVSPSWLEGIQIAIKAAREKGIPVIFDPVGAGATRFRTDVAKQLLQDNALTVLRGNASEILALAGHAGTTKGVESTETSHVALPEARILSQNYHCVVCVSGGTDFIVSGNDDATYAVANGHPLMTRVIGMGCGATALIGAFAAVDSSPLRATTHAMALMGIAGELAAENALGPGSFPSTFLDCLYQIDKSTLMARLKLDQQ